MTCKATAAAAAGRCAACSAVTVVCVVTPPTGRQSGCKGTQPMRPHTLPSPPQYRDAFSLADTLAVLSQPEPGDITAFLHPTVVDASREGGDGFSRDGHPGIAVRVPLDLLLQQRDVMMAGTGGAIKRQPKVLHTDALTGFSVVTDFGVNVIDWPAGSVPSVPAVDSIIQFGAAFLGVDDEGFVAEGGATRDASADLSFSASPAQTYTVGVTIKMSRRLVKQGGRVADELIMRELTRALGQRFDYAFLAGRGAAKNEPTGLMSHAGVLVSAGARLSSYMIQPHITALVGQVAHPVRFRNLRVAAAPTVRGALVDRGRHTAWWDPSQPPSGAFYNADRGPAIWIGEKMEDIPAEVSSACPSWTMFVGDFTTAHLLVHGGVTLIVDPRFDVAGTHRVTILADVAVILPRPRAFLRFVNCT